MIDLTPLDVRKKRGDFRRVLRGYDPGEVDTFLELVESRLETLVMDNLSLTEKTQRLAEQLRALESRERAIQEALVTAQKLREEVQTQSQREADSLLNQAKREAESFLDQAKREVESLRGEATRESSTLRDEAIREAAALRDQVRREVDLHRKEVLAEIEARILEADGLVVERQRALEELERNRRKFLKGFRTLLEREMDAVEVEESRKPLEDNAVELTLRGWSWEDEEASEEEVVGEEAYEGSVPGELVSHEFEPVFDLDAPVGDERVETPGEGPETLPGDEPPEGEFSDIVPVGVFDPPSPEESRDVAQAEQEDAPDEAQALQEDTPDETPEAEDSGEEGGEEGEGRSEEPEEAFSRQDAWGVDAAFDAAVGDMLTSKLNRDPAWGSEPLWLSSLLEQEGEEAGQGQAREEEDGSTDEPADSSVDETQEDEEDEPRID